MQAAKWFDPVLGIDIHMVVVPPSPAPVPLPHPFIAVVFDPIGLAIGAAIGMVFGGGGLVLINNLPVGNTGTNVKAIPHFPMPPGVSFHPSDLPPGNEGAIITGSKTVIMSGSSEGRLTSIVMSCNFPINLPTSVCLAVPMGAPVLIGGPTSLDVMAAITQGIRTKWVSGKLHKLLKAKPGSRLSKVICFLTGHPVDVMTGAVLTSDVDLELPGPVPLKLERNYYSRDTQAGDLGPGWSHALEAAVDEQGGALLVQLADGRQHVYPPLVDGEKIFEPVDRYDLERIGGGYVLRYIGGPALEFAPVPGARRSHPLARMRDGNGNAVELSYGTGRLTSARDSGGRQLRFLRDGEGRLAGVQLRSGERWTELVGYRYDDEGRLAAVLDPLGRPRTYAYRGGVLVRETDRNGLAFHFEYDWDDPDGWCVRTWGDGGLYERTLTYDKNRHVTLVDDGRGGRTHFFGDPAGLVEKMIDPMGAEWAYEWHPEFLKMAVQTDPLGATKTWTYDARGNTLAVTDELARTTSWAYDERDRPIGMTDPAGEVWRRSYDDRGNLVAEVDPLGATCRYSHDTRGDLVRAVDARGHAAQFEHDAAHQVIAATDREGHRERFEYDARGQLIRHIGASNDETLATRDRCGNVVALTRPDGARSSFEYDAEGNQTRHTDALGNVRTYAWTGRGRISARIDPLGNSVRYTYDSEENLVELRNQADEAFRLEYDLCNRPVRTAGFDGTTVCFAYDRLGRRSSVTNGRGQLRSFERDAAGQVVAETGADGLWRRFTRDPRGELLTAQSPAGTLKFTLDACGRTVREAHGDSWLERQYDETGRVVRRRTSTGPEFELRHDRQERLVGLRVGDDEISIERDALGAEVVRRLPADVSVACSRDALGLPTAQRVIQRTPEGRAPDVELHAVDYEWRPEHRLSRRTDPSGTTLFEHDARGALVSAELPDGTALRRVTDAVGNLYKSVDHSDRQYGPGGRLERADGESFEYDGDGNMIARHTADGATWRYEWDSFGLMDAVVRPDGGRVEFVHDALCRRISVRHLDPHGALLRSERALWDDDDVCALDDGDGAWTTWIGLPGEATPLACVRDGELLSAVNDHLGAPMLLMSGREVAWSATHDVYGGFREQGPARCPFRWPGQLADAATGLHYNRFRHYDPRLGRFLSQDPLGPAVGEGMYLYPLDPLWWIDPLGLEDRFNLPGGGSARVDNFPTPKGTGFEIHVYGKNGAEVGVFGPSGFFNKHGHKAADIQVTESVFQRLKGIAVDEMRRLGVLPPKGRGSIKGDEWIKKQDWDNPKPGCT